VGARALEALRALWESPAFTREQAAELRAGLRFGRAAVDRLLASHGDAALGPRGTRRYFAVVFRSP
jgi:hypothetical protein